MRRLAYLVLNSSNSRSSCDNRANLFSSRCLSNCCCNLSSSFLIEWFVSLCDLIRSLLDFLSLSNFVCAANAASCAAFNAVSPTIVSNPAISLTFDCIFLFRSSTNVVASSKSVVMNAAALDICNAICVLSIDSDACLLRASANCSSKSNCSAYFFSNNDRAAFAFASALMVSIKLNLAAVNALVLLISKF